jgi:hypothetical protein
MSPVSTAELVGPPPDSAPPSEPGVSTPRTGNLAAPPQQAVPKNRDTGTGYNTPVQPVQPVRPVQSSMSGSGIRTVVRDLSGRPAGSPLSTMPASTEQVQPAMDPNARTRVQQVNPAQLQASPAPSPMGVQPVKPYQPGVPLAQQQVQRVQAYNAGPGPAQYATSQTPVSTDPANPDPNASLRPGGTSPVQPVQPVGTPQQVNAPSQLDRDQAARDALVNRGSPVHNIGSPWLRAVAGIGDVALSAVAPGIAPLISGTTPNYQRRVGIANQNVQTDQAQQQAAAQTADVNSQTGLRNAQAQADAPFKMTAQQAQEINAPEMEGQTTTPGAFKAAQQQAIRNKGLLDKQGLIEDQLAAHNGLKPMVGPDGKKAYVDDPDSPIYQLKQSQTALNQAKAELAAAGNDPKSPAYQLALKKAQTAQQNANAATTRATAYMGNYLQGAYNKGLGGDTLPGAPIISNDQGAQTVIGTKNAAQAVKAQGNVAQFNDVHGALDSLEQSAKNLVQGGGKLNSPRVAAALAQPHGSLTQWIQGEGAKQGLTPQERDYVIANAAAHENIQALRKAVGSPAIQSSVDKLDALIPNASTPDLNYFLKQTGQIRSTADRLGKGAPKVAGGLDIRPPSGTPQNTGATHVITMKDGSKVNARPSPDGKYWVNAQTGAKL